MRLNARFTGHGNQVSKRMLSYCSSWSNLNTWSNLSICEYVTEVLRTRAPLTLNGNVCKSRCMNVAGHIRFPTAYDHFIFIIKILLITRCPSDFITWWDEQHFLLTISIISFICRYTSTINITTLWLMDIDLTSIYLHLKKYVVWL